MRKKKEGRGKTKNKICMFFDNFYQRTSFLVHYVNTKYVVMIFKFPLFVNHNDIQFLEITRGTTDHLLHSIQAKLHYYSNEAKSKILFSLYLLQETIPTTTFRQDDGFFKLRKSVPICLN